MTAAERMPLTEEQEALLARIPHAIVGTIQPDGRPQLTPTWFLWDGKTFWVSTLSWKLKVRNVRRDPRVTLCIDEGRRQSAYVQVFGTAQVIEGDVREQTLALLRKYEPTEAAARQQWEAIKADRVLIAIRPERMQWGNDTPQVRPRPTTQAG